MDNNEQPQWFLSNGRCKRVLFFTCLGSVLLVGYYQARKGPRSVNINEMETLESAAPASMSQDYFEQSLEFERAFRERSVQGKLSSEDLTLLKKAIETQRKYAIQSGSGSIDAMERLKMLQSLEQSILAEDLALRSDTAFKEGLQALQTNSLDQASIFFARAALLQQTINRDYPQSQSANVERWGYLERISQDAKAQAWYEESSDKFLQATQLEQEGKTMEAVRLALVALDLQRKINHECPRSIYADTMRIKQLQENLATWQSRPLWDEVVVLKLKAQDALAAKEYAQSSILYEKAALKMKTLNQDFPSSFLASVDEFNKFSKLQHDVLEQQKMTAIQFQLQTASEALRGGNYMLAKKSIEDAHSHYEVASKQSAERALLPSTDRERLEYLYSKRDHFEALSQQLQNAFGSGDTNLSAPIQQRFYSMVMGVNPSAEESLTNPVNRMSWDEATEFCERVAWLTGVVVELPNETDLKNSQKILAQSPFGIWLYAPPNSSDAPVWCVDEQGDVIIQQKVKNDRSRKITLCIVRKASQES